MNKITSTDSKKVYDLEERTFLFAKNVCLFCKKLPRTISNIEYVRQLIRASGSVGSNYIEVNKALSKKDFVYRIKIGRKESKESVFWLRLIKDTNPIDFANEALALLNEANELRKIFLSIIEKSK
jgi:four helix bundle protein